MRIVHIIPSMSPQSGGPAYALSQYANLTNAWAEVSILTTTEGWPDNDVNHISEYWNLHSAIELYCFDYKGRHSWKRSNELFMKLDELKGNIDLLHIHACFSLISTQAARWAYQQGIPHIRRPLGTLSNYSRASGMSWLKSMYWHLKERSTLEKATVVHCTSRREAKEITSLTSQHLETRVVPISVSVPKEVYSKTDRERITLGYLGRIHPKKNLEMIFNALRSLNKGKKVHLRIAGNEENEYAQQLKGKANQQGLSKYIEWVGFVDGDEKADFFQSLDWYVLPSKHENFGIAVVEAMSYGVPVVISDQIDIANDVENGEAGFIHSLDQAEFDKMLVHIISLSPEESVQYGKNARLLVESLYSKPVVSEQLKQMYYYCARS